MSENERKRSTELLDMLMASIYQVEAEKKNGCIRLPFNQVKLIEVQHSEDNEQMPDMQEREAVGGIHTEATARPRAKGYLDKLELQ
jgi:hypothetical protein